MRLSIIVFAVCLIQGASQNAALADKRQTPGDIKAPTGPWQTPGEIKAPKGPWQTPGEVKAPKGTLQTPGEVKAPTGVWQKPGDIKAPKWMTIKDGDCEHRLEVGADVLFAFNKWEINPEAADKLNVLGETVQKYGKHPIRVEGHTDGIGTDDYNQDLSEKRAQAVKDWMVGHEYMEKSATVVGYGKRKPIAENQLPDGKDNPAGRAKNRRVDIVVDTCK